MTRDDPQRKLLSEVIAEINTLFGGEFADPQIGGFVVAAAGMTEEDPRIATQPGAARRLAAARIRLEEDWILRSRIDIRRR